ncbi:MAG: hypothetical protein PHO15_08235, partial [Eubacteriales bacterium]|nr:hypothetical protein [Eubacteriales bacterium]
SNGINGSDGINRSDGINGSYGINRSDGINRSYGINGSYGINWSDGINGSYGILNSFGVDCALFFANKLRTYSIFGIDVDEGRFNAVQGNLFNYLDGWKPTFNNLKELYVKSGGEWEKTPIQKAAEISKIEAWKDMPKVAIEYIKSLPEYDAKMFTEITGIE